MEQISHLIIQVSSNQVEAAQKRLDDLGFSATKAEGATKGVTRASDGLMSGMTRLLGPLLSVATAYKAFGKLLSTTREFEILEAQLKTATGSAENAAAAFQAIKDFAATTPYDLAQATESFISLVNRGLDPSERALRSYGNTASAMGMQLDQMVNAVAKATTGEFEPLKSFGIGAKKEADGITFLFRGVATKVRDDVASIEEYFTRLGEANFGNSMEERMKTLDGAISNMGDAWDQMFAQIGDAGAGDFMYETVTRVTMAIQELTDMIASGELQGYLHAIALGFAGWGQELTFARDEFVDFLSNGKSEGAEFGRYLVTAFSRIPQALLAVIKYAGVSIGGQYLYIEAGLKAAWGIMKGYFTLFLDGAKSVGELMWKNLTSPTKVKDNLAEFFTAQQEAMSKFGTDATRAFSGFVKDIDAANTSVRENINLILDQYEATNQNQAAAVSDAQAKRAQWEEQKRINAALNEFFGVQDRLAKFRVGTGGGRIIGEEERRRFEALQDSLVDEEVAVQRSYDRRLQLIRDNTVGQADLEAMLTDELNQRKLVEMDSARDQKFARLGEEYAAEQNLLQRALDNKLITEQQFQAKSQENWNSYTASVKGISVTGTATLAKIQAGMMADVLGRASDVAAQMAAMVKEGSGAQKALFVTAKLLAMGQAFIMTQLAAIACMAPPPIGLGPVMGAPYRAAILGLGYASIALMGAQTVTEVSQHEHGGMIPSGKFGLVGETGVPELVRGPAMVSSARTTADRNYASGGGGGSVTVNVINQAGAEVQTQEREGSDGKIIDIIVKKVKSELAGDIRTGGNPVSRAFETTYAMRRGVA